jgi:hypothetical protein
MPDDRPEDQLLALARQRLGITDDPVEHDEEMTRSRHTRMGTMARRDLRRGRDAHVFLDGLNLARLERDVWARGEELVAIRRWRRFWLEFTQQIGQRIKNGRAPVPLRGLEIKASFEEDGVWRYHLVPRATKAKDKKSR